MNKWLVVACGLWLGACASVSPHGSGSAAKAAASQLAPRSVAIFRSGGTRAEWNELVDAAAQAEVVFVGENHGHPLGLASAAALFEDVVARCPKAALSMEFFERDEQSRLDDYLTGASDLATLEKRAARSDGNFPPGHRAMVETARANARPVHAANAPRQYVRLANREGYERLANFTWEQKRLFRVPDFLVTGRYRDDFDRVMTPSERDPKAPEEQERLSKVFRSQQMWDWTMAESLYVALANGEAPLVHVVGRFHSDFRGGTVQALEALRPATKTLIVSFVDADAPVALAESDLGRGDFVIFVGPSRE
ncbi:MAG: ChaN family lipoprotein [Planctomycetaceae bacterium]|nr:ChaN family lipoprotein [Planctomycetaceae bacterium]